MGEIWDREKVFIFWRCSLVGGFTVYELAGIVEGPIPIKPASTVVKFSRIIINIVVAHLH